MLYTLEVLPAAQGDCLLIHWGTVQSPKLAVIDGGPGRVYENHLRPRLDQIATNLRVTPLPLELVMVSHMDSDHIVGIKKLVRDIRRDIDDHVPPNQRGLVMKRLWLNVFNDVLGDAADKYFRTFNASFQASVNGQPAPTVIVKLADAFRERHHLSLERAREAAFDIGLVLAGHGEGRDVRDDHKFLFDHQQCAALNTPFKDSQGRPTLITTERTPTAEKIQALEFKIVGPSNAEIETLQEEFDEYITEKGLTAEAVLAAYADDSAKNLSSIVSLVTFGDKTILLTGDARGDLILDGLEAADLVSAGGSLTVDVLKVPHHGSDRNVEQDFFKRIVAKTYVISGDGKYGNPDRDTLQMIADARGKTASYTILLTYDVPKIDIQRKADFLKKGKIWKQNRDSLEAFFTEADQEGCAFSVHAGAPATINLGDESIAW
jgi:beta-lactamase superfamily II metal-dependent hydrolase